jgi:hypothetical protein
MTARRGLYLALAIGLLAGLGFVRSRWVHGREVHQEEMSRQVAQAQDAESWRNGHPSHWRACLLEHGTGLLSRTESFRIP